MYVRVITQVPVQKRQSAKAGIEPEPVGQHKDKQVVTKQSKGLANSNWPRKSSLPTPQSPARQMSHSHASFETCIRGCDLEFPLARPLARHRSLSIALRSPCLALPSIRDLIPFATGQGWAKFGTRHPSIDLLIPPDGK